MKTRDEKSGKALNSLEEREASGQLGRGALEVSLLLCCATHFLRELGAGWLAVAISLFSKEFLAFFDHF